VEPPHYRHKDRLRPHELSWPHGADAYQRRRRHILAQQCWLQLNTIWNSHINEHFRGLQRNANFPGHLVKKIRCVSFYSTFMTDTGMCCTDSYQQITAASNINVPYSKTMSFYVKQNVSEQKTIKNFKYIYIYIRVSFCDGSFYDDSILRPLPSRTKHSRLVVHHCRNSSVLSLFSALLAFFPVCICFFFFNFSAVLWSWLWFFHPWRPSRIQIVLFCKKEWKEQGRLTLETKMLVIRKMDAGEKRKLKPYVVT
jgi:hypothetical protein